MDAPENSKESGQKDSPGSVSPLWVRIIAGLFYIGLENLKIGTSKKYESPNPRKVARKILQGRFPPSGSILLPVCFISAQKIEKLAPRKNTKIRIREKQPERFSRVEFPPLGP